MRNPREETDIMPGFARAKKKVADLVERHPPSLELRRAGIDATDRKIDRLVCEVYGLTEKEIGVVEED